MSAEPAGTESKQTLPQALAAVAALLFSVALLLMGNGLQGTLLPVRSAMEHFASFEIGLQGTGYFLGFTLGCLFGPVILRRGGHIRTFMAMASVASVAVLLHAMFPEPLLWPVLRGITGVCFAVLYIVIESWLNEKSSNERRGTIFSIYTVINLTVITIGQMMIAMASPESFVLFAVASILVSVAALPLAFTTAESPMPFEAAKPNLKRLWRISPVGFAGCLAVGLGNGAFWSLAPVFAQEKGMDTAGIGLFMSVVVIGGAIAQYPLGALSDRIDRRLVVVAAATVGAIAGLLMTFLPGESGERLLIFGALFGAGALPVYALTVAHTNDHAKPEEMVQVSSGLLLVFGAGAVIGPMVASLLKEALPWPTLFAYTAAVHILLVVYVLWRMTRRTRAAEDDRVTFKDSAIVATTVLPIEPEPGTDPQETGTGGVSARDTGA